MKRALNSCFAQTYPNLEIIVVNDASADGTREWLDAQQGNIRVFHNEQASGAPFSRNFGASAAKGEYLCFLDDDDEILPAKIERQVACFLQSNDPKLGIVSCDSLEIRRDREFVLENRKRGELHKALLSKYCVVGGTMALLIRRDAFLEAGMFDVKLKSNQEYDLMIHIARTRTFDFVPEVLVHKYETEGQISTNFRKKSQGTRYFMKKNQREYRQYGPFFYVQQMIRLSALVVVYELSRVMGYRFYRLLFP